MKKIFLSLVLLTSLLVISCSDEEITRDPDSIGYQYYPLEVGKYWIFNVTENTYTNNERVATSSYQAREWIDTTLTDQTGRKWYRVQLSRRTSASANWTISGVKLISLGDKDLRVQENNKTTVQMVFPVKNGYTFVSNAFIDSENQIYLTYADLGKTYTENGKTYENTLTVIKADFENVVDLDEEYTILAPGIGPVNRTDTFRYFCDGSSGSNCTIGTNYIVAGSDKIEVLESTGKM